MATPNNQQDQRPPMFRPGIPPQQQQRPVFTNRPSLPHPQQLQGQSPIVPGAAIRPPPPFGNQQHAIRPGFSPYRPPGNILFLKKNIDVSSN
jgi:hypothetical protein